jgi:hypothetical protein
VEVAMPPTFSCFVFNVIAASPIVVPAKYMTGQWEPIAAIKAKANPKSRRVLPPNAPGQQKKEIDVKTKQPILVVAVISTNFSKANQYYEKVILVRNRSQN